MKRTIRNITRKAAQYVAAAGMLTGTLGLNQETQAQSQQPQETPIEIPEVRESPIVLRTTLDFSQDANIYELGLGDGSGILKEGLKIIATERNGEIDYLAGIKTKFNLGDLSNIAYLTHSSANDGFGAELFSTLNNTTLEFALDRTDTAFRAGAGIEQVLNNGDIAGIRFDHRDSETGNDISQTLLRYLRNVSPETDLGISYAFRNNSQGEDSHIITSFASYAGPEVDLGGRAWAQLNLTGDDWIFRGQGIIGQNFRNGYTRFAIKGNANGDATLNSLSTFQSPSARDIIKYAQPWTRVESGLAASIFGRIGETNGNNFSSLYADAAYVIPLGENTKIVPTITYSTDFEDASRFGWNIEWITTRGDRQLRVRAGLSDIGDTDSAEFRMMYTIPF